MRASITTSLVLVSYNKKKINNNKTSDIKNVNEIPEPYERQDTWNSDRSYRSWAHARQQTAADPANSS